MTDQPGDEYEALFRPDEPVPPVQNFEVEDEVAVVEPRSVGPIETGRVFRSQGVQGNEEALLALSSARTSKLRTLERVDVRPESEHVSEVGIAMHSPVPERAGHVSPPVIPREERSTQHTQYTQRGAVFGSLGALYVYGIAGSWQPANKSCKKLAEPISLGSIKTILRIQPDSHPRCPF